MSKYNDVYYKLNEIKCLADEISNSVTKKEEALAEEDELKKYSIADIYRIAKEYSDRELCCYKQKLVFSREAHTSQFYTDILEYLDIL